MLATDENCSVLSLSTLEHRIFPFADRVHFMVVAGNRVHHGNALGSETRENDRDTPSFNRSRSEEEETVKMCPFVERNDSGDASAVR